MMRPVLSLAALALLAGCATAPPPAAPVVPVEQKFADILRLEDRRVLRDPEPPPPVVPEVRGRRAPAVAPAPPVADLVRWLGDPEGRVRRRAALAIGRVGLPDGVTPLVRSLQSDGDPEVRRMAAFGLGLLGDRGAVPALTSALGDADPWVQGRAAEALGLIGASDAATEIGAMIATHVQAGRLGAVAADDLRHPLEPEVEAFRLGVYALARLKAWDPLASAVLDGAGAPRVRWWPVAFALGRLEDPRAVPALTAFARGTGTDAVAFAARGLGQLKAVEAIDALLPLVDPARQDPRVVAQAVRALGAIGDARASGPLVKLLLVRDLHPALRIEVLTALGAMRSAEALEEVLDMIVAPTPAVRGAAFRAAASIDPLGFVAVLSGIDDDPVWLVRAELAAALREIDPAIAIPRLTAMLDDADQRVLPRVLEALTRHQAPGLPLLLRARLESNDVVVRATAARLLGESKDAASAPALVEAWQRARADNTYVARAAALRALMLVSPASARGPLGEALEDKDWAMRRRAAEWLREIEPDADVSAIRPAPTRHADPFYATPAVVSPPYSPQVYLETRHGTIQIELAVLEAPLTVESFVSLARRGYFDGLTFHRVVANFVVQGGDPRSDGEGGPGYTIRDELNDRPYLRGTVGMALDWADTGGSQFFITHGPQPHLDARYTVFGQVVAGMEVVDRIARGDVIERVRVWDGVTP
jgi:cyclophilin family peptidyl-prolyl cis-trans isomerase/HEAT repeat protein